jgi:Methyl-accepting chemotaxis protein (MCP) signalling domain
MRMPAPITKAATMRDNGPITGLRFRYPTSSLLVSQTDTGGRITFANDAFVAISGFTWDELLGSPHSVVRHPHMPMEAFRDLWTTHANEITREAVDESSAAKQTITELRDEVERIGHIASLIADIAGKTNLLALNATIEAARAGEAGKGFAVVANEVKTSAGQTAKATKDIGNQISQIQHGTVQTVGAVTRIGDKVAEIDQVSVAISAAMEEQSAATQEISRSVGQAAAAVQSVTEMMTGVVDLASRTNDWAGHLSAEADSLARSVDASRATVVGAVRASVTEAA